jgi:hypothetical protein
VLSDLQVPGHVTVPYGLVTLRMLASNEAIFLRLYVEGVRQIP